ncbi:MAG: sigma-70 family RNA polymerase sigma factor [Acidobacteria bacterium]|nr:sigma-70 family RNA polymerase sigma factor [Acidobacteriota bacterium]
MNEQASERLMIEACQKGDREAFRHLYENHKDRVFSIALHFIGDEAAARDITQQVFLKLFTGIGKFRHESGFSTWLYRLVVNACLDEQRRRKRFLSFDIFRSGDDQPGNDQPGVPDQLQALHLEQSGQWSSRDDNYSRMQQSAMVKTAVRKLKPRLRIAILLKYFEGMTYEEMAQVLGCSAGTVASRLNRGHSELARLLKHLRP